MLYIDLATLTFMNCISVLSSPEPKDQVSFSYDILFVVRLSDRLSVCLSVNFHF